MTHYSQNGYPACVPSLLAHYNVLGRDVVMRRGATSTVLIYFAQRWNSEIEHVRMLGCYACRSIIGPSPTFSNHASGTAIDINWDVHPLGAYPSAALSAKVHRILNTRVGGIRVGSVIRWGGDYNSRKDNMHGEINAPLALVSRLAAAILVQHAPAPSPYISESLMEGIIKPASAPVAGKPPAQFYYNFIHRIWIKDADHLSRIEGEYKKRYGKDIVTTTIGFGSVIRDGRYGQLVGPDAPAGTY